MEAIQVGSVIRQELQTFDPARQERLDQVMKDCLEIMDQFGDDVRHPIVTDNPDAARVITLASGLVYATSRNKIPAAMVLAETIYCMGFQAGREDRELRSKIDRGLKGDSL